MGDIEAIAATGTAEAIEVRDEVEAGDVVRAVESIEYMQAAEVGGAGGEVKVVGIAAAGATNSIMATVSAAEILEVIQLLSLLLSSVRGSSGFRPSIVIAFLQSCLGSARSDISVISYLTIMPHSVTTPLI
jgi:hypothetical protein